MRQLSIVVTLMLGAVAAQAQPRPVRDATLHDATGKDVGRVTLQETNGRVTVKVHVQDLPAGIHGLHLHQVAKCEPPSFEGAGAHYNPTNKEHGRQNRRGPHLGDLGNITVAGNGQGDREVTITAAMARSLTTFLGAGLSVVVHANEDDEKTDPAGNSGARIACTAILP